jgi:hypothetical protein
LIFVCQEQKEKITLGYSNVGSPVTGYTSMCWGKGGQGHVVSVQLEGLLVIGEVYP